MAFSRSSRVPAGRGRGTIDGRKGPLAAPTTMSDRSGRGMVLDCVSMLSSGR